MRHSRVIVFDHGAVRRLALVALAAAACGGPRTSPGVHPDRTAASRPARTASIRYEMTHDPAAEIWRVQLHASGIDPAAGEVRLVLENWGEWSEVDSYLRDLRVEPPVRPDPKDPSRFTVETPPNWDGTLEASYSLAPFDSDVHKAHGLLPTFDHTHAVGFAINTVADLHQGGAAIVATRTVRLVAPARATVFTGWGGVSRDSQEVRFDHAIDNTPIGFGAVTQLATDEADGVRYEVVQFGSGPDATTEALRVARAIVPLAGRHAGRPVDQPVRIVFTPLTGGGTRTDHGCIVGAADDAEAVKSPSFVRLLAHELFHEWLGGFLVSPDDESLVWFHEGFTEYFTVWHVSASGLLGPDWFAETIVASDARARGSSAFGKVAFADPAVRWRDGNGPNETLGYRGGAILAFHADVELRKQGRPGLMQLVADLLKREDKRLTRESIRGWMESNGLREFHEKFVAKPAPLPEVGPALRSIGYEARDTDTTLTYLGLQVEPDGIPGNIVAIDPDGPAAGAGLAVGDRIVGYAPNRDRPPRIAEGLKTPYRFGLTRIASGAETVRIDYRRDGVEHTANFAMKLMPGGKRTEYRARADATAPFFRYEPPAVR